MLRKQKETKISTAAHCGPKSRVHMPGFRRLKQVALITTGRALRHVGATRRRPNIYLSNSKSSQFRLRFPAWRLFRVCKLNYFFIVFCRRSRST